MKVSVRPPNSECRGTHMNNTVLQPVLSHIYRCDININFDRPGSPLYDTQSRFRLHAKRLRNQKFQRSSIVQLYSEQCFPKCFAGTPFWVRKINIVLHILAHINTDCPEDTYTTLKIYISEQTFLNYEGWNFNSGNYLFTTDTK